MNLLEYAISETVKRMEKYDQQALEWALKNPTAKWYLNGVNILPAEIERWEREGRWRLDPDPTNSADQQNQEAK